MIKTILVALGGTRYTPIGIRHAVELGAAHGAEVTGVTCVNLDVVTDVGPVPIGGGAAAVELVQYRQQVTRAHVEDVVRRFEESCAEAGVRHRVAREEGRPFEALRCLWRYHDLTVVGLRGLFEYGLEREPEDYLLEMLVFGVRPILAISTDYRPVRRVLIAYDGSPEAAKSMKQLVQARLWPDLAFRVVVFGRRIPDADALLADAAGYCRAHGYAAETAHDPAAPRDRLLAHAAEWGADLIVMGASRRAKVLRHVLGDTALTAIRRAEVPLFLSQ